MSTIITILFLVLLNGFFSLTEMAIVACRKSILKDMVKKGNKNAEKVLEIIDEQGKFLSTIQVGITTVGILAAAYGGAKIAHSFGRFLDGFSLINPYGDAIAIVVVVTVLTYFSVVIGELVPKRIALKNPEKIAIFIVRPVLIFAWVFAPIIAMLDFSAAVVMRFFGASEEKDNLDAEAELKAIISEGVEEGTIEKSEHEIVQRIFRLDDRDAKSIMTHVSELDFIRIDEDDEEIRFKLENAKHSRYPVVQGDSQKVIGVVQVKEIFADYLQSGEINITKHIDEAHFIPENINCLKVLEMFKASSINLAIVIDEYGSTEGIVTASDIFEAVVGMLPANYDEDDEVMITKRDDGSWLVDGTTPVEEISLTLGIEEIDEEEEDFDTIAGFVSFNLQNLEKEVKEGAKFEKYGHVFEVLDMDGMIIDKVLLDSVKKED